MSEEEFMRFMRKVAIDTLIPGREYYMMRSDEEDPQIRSGRFIKIVHGAEGKGALFNNLKDVYPRKYDENPITITVYMDFNSSFFTSIDSIMKNRVMQKYNIPQNIINMTKLYGGRRSRRQSRSRRHRQRQSQSRRQRQSRRR